MPDPQPVRMTAVLKFLLVDNVAENRFLLATALLRKFPRAIIEECQHSAPALAAAAHEHPTAIAVHCADDMDGIDLVARLRRLNLTVPIILLSSRESCPEAITAGASMFLNHRAWLRLDTVVEEAIDAQSRDAEPGRLPLAAAAVQTTNGL
jgi:CheY-like chemotaxis protein